MLSQIFFFLELLGNWITIKIRVLKSIYFLGGRDYFYSFIFDLKTNINNVKNSLKIETTEILILDELCLIIFFLHIYLLKLTSYINYKYKIKY